MYFPRAHYCLAGRGIGGRGPGHGARVSSEKTKAKEGSKMYISNPQTVSKVHDLRRAETTECR